MIVNLLNKLNHTDEDVPLIITTTDRIYAPAYIVEEDERMLSVVIVDDIGHEFGKIINKDYLVSIEIFYDEMLIDEDDNDEQKMYN